LSATGLLNGERVDGAPEQARSQREQWFSAGEPSDATWPDRAWSEICSRGITRWGIPEEYGGVSLSADELLRGMIELARGSLLATFILSQFQAAGHRLVRAASPALRERWLPGLASGRQFATVGISHLTTSRQHTIQPAVQAVPTATGYRLTGEIPWVTGGGRADVLVAGGTLPNGRQILTAIPTDNPGVTIGEPLRLAALSGSETCAVKLTDVEIEADAVMAGPMERVVQQFGGSGAGSLMTSALGLGHALGCLDHLRKELAFRPELQSAIDSLSGEAEAIHTAMIGAAGSGEGSGAAESLRTRSTDLALRGSQALMTASKGAGFLAGHPAESLARQALFFLVWSCPQGVANQLLQSFGRCEMGF